MSHYYNFRSFDISHITEQYRNKRIEEIYPNHSIKYNEMGQFMEIIWTKNLFEEKLNLKLSKWLIIKNLKAIYYIGDRIERNLNRRGVKTLYDLKYNLKYRNSALKLLSLIREKNHSILCQNRYINDLDVVFCFDIEDILFLDIETLGVYDSPIIILGLGFYRNNEFEIHIFFVRNLEEEIAMLEYFKSEILPQFKCFITYNGKSFDIPNIANRFLYFYDNNPMISATDVPYQQSNTKFHHVDLYHSCRRRYKGAYESYTLKDMEESLLNLRRDNDLPGSLVGFCYKKYLHEPRKCVGLIKEIIEHNYWDVYSMPLILQNLIQP